MSDKEFWASTLREIEILAYQHGKVYGSGGEDREITAEDLLRWG